MGARSAQRRPARATRVGGMRRLGLLLVLLGLLVELAQRAYFAALNFELVDPPIDSYDTVLDVTTALGLVSIALALLGVLLLLGARTAPAPRPGPQPGAPGGSYGSRNPPPPTYLS
jgi:hypothetical protein